MEGKRILIIGCPGSGKSTFARALSAKTGIPAVHLDLLYWNSDASSVAQDVFLKRLEDALAGESWIIDGNYASTLQMRLKRADRVFFLDYPVETCLKGICARRGMKRPDLPWIENGGDAEFMDFVRRFPEKTRPRMLEILSSHPETVCTVFACREEAEAFLQMT